ncbi:hypothetical protein KAFR_0D00400 [Kazachstania africana CBS 2517]|uniref:Ribosomal RNA-processing protein 7 C-terminal domain-containing protein n=1 Tax=Kazachstania africana (strain ATCC 22294 / BCRC 22015 / CBS 2517 / CECT 1963 / NBRC 1671 / NRRL Y-8276) TaxID=1071382 RepID=H2ATI7_KAZAF|nr:hypothetical protein KAFR_0D00400 [Kazachstania africana CBS 2517]CCF57687.1 hypothetical protein KAFR_0D00400 [Kazachstania africana CBS 2517]
MVKVDSMKNGFLVIPFKLPKYKSVEKVLNKKDAYHYMFFRRHESKNEQEKNCLFVVNIPLLTNLDTLKGIMNKICASNDTVSHIEDLLFNDEFGLQEIDLSSLTSDLMADSSLAEKRFTPRNTALLKFLDEPSLNNCWNSLKRYSKNKPENLLEWAYTSPSISTFVSFYKPLDIDYLKESVYTHLSLFEQREEQAQEDIQRSLVDEDGFTLVVGKNTKTLNSIKKKILNRNPLSKHESKKPILTTVDKKAKKDFYRFQVREHKKQEIDQLLAKFKQDQEKVKIMKAKRKFNPYKNNL